MEVILLKSKGYRLNFWTILSIFLKKVFFCEKAKVIALQYCQMTIFQMEVMLPKIKGYRPTFRTMLSIFLRRYFFAKKLRLLPYIVAK